MYRIYSASAYAYTLKDNTLKNSQSLLRLPMPQSIQHGLSPTQSTLICSGC